MISLQKPLPLCQEEPDIIIDLQTILQEIYDEARYDLIIDYQQNITPPLSSQEIVWIDNLLKQKELR